MSKIWSTTKVLKQRPGKLISRASDYRQYTFWDGRKIVLARVVIRDDESFISEPIRTLDRKLYILAAGGGEAFVIPIQEHQLVISV